MDNFNQGLLFLRTWIGIVSTKNPSETFWKKRKYLSPQKKQAEIGKTNKTGE
jgi:hypothetical protein